MNKVPIAPALSEADYVSALRERIKELSCLYSIADLANRPGLELENLLQQVVEVIPPSMMYPDQAMARLIIDGVSYLAPGYTESGHFIKAGIVVESSPRGQIEVHYPDSEEQLEFLPEEQQLLIAVANQVALLIERKHIEESNSRLQEQLRHADRLATLGQLSAGIAHEINEPLSTILGYAQLIKEDGQLKSDSASDLGKIISATLHAREVVRKLMLFSRQMPPRLEAIDLNRLIEDGFYFLESRCSHQGVRIVRDLALDLPPLMADPGQIHQVLVNLTVNAMQALPDGGTITIRTLLKGKNVEISVSDNGIGMDSDLLQKIFIPFFTTKEIDQGTGLGLAVVHGIVTTHNGKIKVESKPGRGSVFKVSLPVKPEAAKGGKDAG